MRSLALIILMLAVMSPAAAQDSAAAPDRLRGILELPPLCYWPCHKQGASLPLYPAPEISAPAMILTQEMLFAEGFQDRDSPYWPDSEEFDYERSGAIVYEEREGWYRIRIGRTDYWAAAADAGTFHPYPQITQNRLAYLLGWDFLLWDTPGQNPALIDHPFAGNEELAGRIPARVINFARHDGQWWAQVEVLAQSPCLKEEAPVFAKGWVPAYAPDSRHSLWFYPRGC